MTDTPLLLIVDDDFLTLRFLADLLGADHEVRTAMTGREALAMARQAPHPDLILLDVMLPDRDGHAVCATLKRDATTRDIPVIFLTAYGDPDRETRALAEGAVDFLHKPVTPAVVRARVRLHLELRRQQAELIRHRDHLDELVQVRTRELAQARDAAEAANRAKSAFLANMSHEMRTPLSHILGFAYLERHRAQDDRLKASLAKIDRAAQRLLDLVNDVLDLSRIEAGPIQLEDQPFNLGESLNQALRGCQDAATAKGLALVQELDPQAPAVVRGDPARLRQVLGQLLGNAVKFSERGTIHLRARALDGPPGQAHLRFEVEDEGIGMTPEVQAGLFQVFNQGDNSLTRPHPGTGLGLALCQRLVALMGGAINVTSTPGQGSRFGFELSWPVGE